MREKGNSNVQVCMDNLLKTIQGEVPYAREKGIKRNIVDLPSDTAKLQMVMSANECIATYEPRVDVRETRAGVVEINGNLSYEIKTRPKIGR